MPTGLLGTWVHRIEKRPVGYGCLMIAWRISDHQHMIRFILSRCRELNMLSLGSHLLSGDQLGKFIDFVFIEDDPARSYLQFVDGIRQEIAKINEGVVGRQLDEIERS